MTRRALREHCFKMLFCTDYYPVEEADEQIIRYFGQPSEDDTDDKGESEIIHEVKLNEEDEEELKTRVDDIIANNQHGSPLPGYKTGWLSMSATIRPHSLELLENPFPRTK